MKKQYLLVGLALVTLLVVSVALVQDKLVTAAPVFSETEETAASNASIRDNAAFDSALAQENADVFATIDLKAGFLLDPYLLRVSGGGDTDASSLDAACSGFIDTDPNVVLNWSGNSNRLNVFVYSDSDPVLVIETPDGEFVCSDDANQAILDPIVTLENPDEGSYNIHVGSYDKEDLVMGFLVITELGIEDDLANLDLTPMLDRRDYAAEELLAPVSLNDLYLREDAIFGSSDLRGGFETITITAIAGGTVPIYPLDGNATSCAGFAGLVPSYSVNWTGVGNMSVLFEAEENTTLLVVTPQGEVFCADNASEDNLNPVLDLLGVVGGQYDIFIGSYDPATVTLGTLTITADLAAEPQTLSPDSE